MEVPAHMVDTTDKSKDPSINQSAKAYVKERANKLFKVQKNRKLLTKKDRSVIKKKVYESEKEMILVKKLQKKIIKDREDKKKNTDTVYTGLKNELQDLWGNESMAQKKFKWDEKPTIKAYDKVRNPAIMIPNSGESYNPSQKAYSKMIDTLFDKGKILDLI